MRLGLAIASLIFLTPAYGIADVTRMHVCERANITRIVELQSDGETGLPCRVVYKRPMEDQSATSLWNAQSDVEYCVQKYDAFIAKIENKHNWSCTAELPDPTIAPAASKLQTPAHEIPTTPISSIDSGLSAQETSLKNPEGPSTEAARDDMATLPSPAEPVEPLITTPNLGSALPFAENGQASDRSLSMSLIRQLIPSGQYVTDGELPHSGSTALCPADGFFIWSTKRPGRPAFEMGPDESFQFDLTGLTDEPLLAGADSALNRQCHEEVAASYCSDSMYTGSTPIHPELSRYFGCGTSAGNTAQRRSLVLFRTITEQTGSTRACRSTPSLQHMALGSAGNHKVVDAHRSSDGIELVILPMRSDSAAIADQNGAICHYIRG